ncbi:hypothetical protein TL16_g00956 [Triparma laevis f. inornata]|uniref:Methyltransferase FkbM domain-containing protein n=1 Tax=Triparma laevis f. inornata TaxID=1714386 RepID=A0A9W6ZHK9_9STRA|nr:hypothetical protein TL16_g00956 [Triparma laevis f. inornata]
MLSNAASTKAETKIRTSLAIAHRLISSSPLNVAIGVAPHEMVVPPPYSHLFIPTDLNTLDVTDSDDFEYYFPPNSVSAFIAEHVWEHLALQEAIDALINVRLALKVGGVVRIAVPDRFSYCSNQDNNEAEMHRTDVRDEHLVQYDFGLLSEVFKSAGFASTEITLIEHHTAQGDFLVSVLSDEDPAFQNTNIQRRYSNGRVGPGSSLIIQATKIKASPLPNNSWNSSSTSPSSKCVSEIEGMEVSELVGCTLTIPRGTYARQLAEHCLAHKLPRLADFFFDLAMELEPEATRKLKIAAGSASLGGERRVTQHFIFSKAFGGLKTAEDAKELGASLERLSQGREAARAMQIATSHEILDAQILHLCTNTESTHTQGWGQTLTQPAPQQLLFEVDLSCWVGSQDVPGVIACSHVVGEAGSVLQATCEGSFIFANLPDGQYTIISKLYSYNSITELDSKVVSFVIGGNSEHLKILGEETEPDKGVPLSFVTIVLNGANFLNHHYKTFELAARRLGVEFEWHVIEGVSEGRQDHKNPYSTKVLSNLHRTKSNLSVDGTTKFLDLLSQEHENVKIHRVAPRVFRDKIEQINTALPFLQRSILLQVDADELWGVEEIVKLYEVLTAEGGRRGCVKVDCHFFVGPGRVTEGAGSWGHGEEEWVRGWKFEPGSLFISHAPPVLVRPGGGEGEWYGLDNCVEDEGGGIGFSHYAYVFESQVQFKEDFYGYNGAVEGWRDLQNVDLNVGVVKANAFLPWLKEGAKGYEARFEDTVVVDAGTRGGLNFSIVSLGADAHIDSYEGEEEKGGACSFRVMVDCVTFQRSNGGITRVWSEVLPRLVKNLAGEAGEGACFTFLVRGGGRGEAGWPWVKEIGGGRFEYEFVDAPIFPEGGDEGAFALDSEILGAIAKERKADIFVSTQYTFPSSAPSVRNVLLVHDLTPETFAWEEDFWKLKAKAVSVADHIVTVSAATTEKLKIVYGEGVPVVTSRNGVDLSVFYRRGEEEVRRLRAELGLGDASYLLVVGQRGGYKSTHALVQTLREKFREGEAPAVVFVGGGEFKEEERRELGGLMAWHFSDVEDEALAGLYSGAAGLVYLSVDEGFGLPVVKALACGCGVVASDIPVFHEVAGGGGGGQDSWAWWAFGGGVGGGRGSNPRWFVELGANDGITLSNTYALESCGGWLGVCIEPTAAYDSLMSSGRVKCAKMREAVAGGIRKATLIGSRGNVEGLMTGGTLWAGLSEHFKEKSTWQAGDEIARDESSLRVLDSGGEEEVVTKTLGDVLDAAGAPNHVDFLSLDVEGAEFEILESFPYGRRSFGLIVVEHAYVEEKRVKILELLEANGYVRSICFDSDDGYVLRSLVEPGGLLEDMPFNDAMCDMSNKRVTFRCAGELERGGWCEENGFGRGEKCDFLFDAVVNMKKEVCLRGVGFHTFSIDQPLVVDVGVLEGYEGSIYISSEEGLGSWAVVELAKEIAGKYCKDNHAGIILGEGVWGLSLEECEKQMAGQIELFMRVYSDGVKGEAMSRTGGGGGV